MKRTGDPRTLRLAYILAASHSGSTLLTMLLGSHSEVCTVGELKLTSLGDVNRYRCSCRAEIRKCPFWTGVSEDMASRGFPFDLERPGTHIGVVESRYARRLLKPLHRGPFLEWMRDATLSLSPAWRSHLRDHQARNAALAACLVARTGKNVIADSSKIGLRLKYLLRNPALDVLVIRLVRDGRGVALTYADPAQFADASDPSLRGGGTGESRGVKRLSIAEAARQWRRSNEEAESILKYLDRSRWIEVRYETLCNEPEETLRRIFTFIGVDPDYAVANMRFVEHHVVGNGMRLDSTGDITLDDRWRSVLTRPDLEVFESVAGAMRSRLGYR